MNQTRQTLAFVVVATVLAGVAVATHLASRVTPSAEFEKVGTAFYDGFDDPNKATSLRVVSYNADEARVSEFQVEFKDGLWRIPSHHNYPADAKDRLAKAAASLIAVERDALASRREADHERFGVINPETDDVTQLKGLGQRVTLKEGRGQVLADLIIGDEVEGQEGYYYVRRPDEKETFRARLNVDLSTKFANWIEQDLLKMDRWNAVRLVLSKPGVNEEGRIIDSERVELSRADTAGQWQLAGLDEKTEEVNRTAVDDLLRNLDDLEIVGVRPKPRGITADIKLEIPASIAENPLAVRAFRDALLTDLERKGFGIGGGIDDQPRIYSREGEVLLATNDGVAYRLHLGDVFTGTLEEVEIGGKSDEASESGSHAEGADKSADGQDPSAAADSGDDSSSTASADDPPKNKDGVKLHRYVFVRAQFDPAHIGPEPVQPEEPQKPAGLEDVPAATAPDAPEKDGGAEKPSADIPQEPDGNPPASDSEAPTESNEPPANRDSESSDEQLPPEAAEPQPAAAADPADGASQPADKPSATADAPQQDPAAAEQARLKFEYDAARKAYESSLKEYERKRADYDRKAKEGREKVEELNRRFRDWYYVISGTSLENLKIARADLVKAKTATEPAGKTEGAAPGPALPPGNQPADASSAEDAPAAAKPQPDDNSASQPAPATAEPAAPPEQDPAAAQPDASAADPEPDQPQKKSDKPTR